MLLILESRLGLTACLIANRRYCACEGGGGKEGDPHPSRLAVIWFGGLFRHLCYLYQNEHEN